MTKNKRWTNDVKSTITQSKHWLANLSIQVRTDQYRFLEKLHIINQQTTVLDVGTTSQETLKDSNLFLKQYPYPDKLTTATIEDSKKLQMLYPNIKVTQIYPNEPLSFKDQSFDLVTAWAVLEHVGGYKKQQDFLNEALRVGKHIFITTPYRGCIYEPHSGLFFVQWLPLNIFRLICEKLNKPFWSTEDNLNPLYMSDVSKMKLTRPIKVTLYKMFGFLPSHLIITDQYAIH